MRHILAILILSAASVFGASPTFENVTVSDTLSVGGDSIVGTGSSTGTVASGDDPRFVNKIDTLKWTRKSISDRTAISGLNPIVRILTLGDSLAQDGWPREGFQTFGTLYRCFIPASNSVTTGATVTTADFTRWPSGQYHTLTGTGSVIYPSSTTGFTSGTAKVYYVIEPGAGAINIKTKTINLDGSWPASWTIVSGTLSTSGTATTAGVANIALSGGAGQYQVAVENVSGTNRVLGCIPLTTAGGAVEMSGACSGSIISQQTQTSQAILNAVLSDFQPTLVFWRGDETVEAITDDLPVLVAKTETAYANLDWVFTSLHPNITYTDEETKAKNVALRSFSDSHGSTYVDMFTPFTNQATMVALGWLTDDIHFTPTGYNETARIQWAALPGLREWPSAAGAQKFYLPTQLIGTRQSNFLFSGGPGERRRFGFSQDTGASAGFYYPALSDGYAAGRMFFEHNSINSNMSLASEGLWIIPFGIAPHSSGLSRGPIGSLEVVPTANGLISTVVGGTAGQTADLMQWRAGMTLSSTGTALGRIDSSGNITFSISGLGLKIKEGSNARAGTATLTSGSVTISNTTVTGSTRFVITPNEAGTMNGRLRVSARVSGTSFSVSSSDAGDNCGFDWMLWEPAP